MAAIWEWIRTAEGAELIFYGLLAGLALAEVVLRYVLKVAKDNIVLEYVDSGFVAILLALVIRTFIIQAYKIPSPSMNNTLLEDDHLLVNKFMYGTRLPLTQHQLWRFWDPKRGDIIVFQYPKNPRKDFIKRCIGVPGDVLEIRNKSVILNGVPQVEPYTTFADLYIQPGWLTVRDNFGPVTVPAESYFMMGDNRDRSLDSRFWGFVPRKYVRGKAWVIYWPPNRWRLVK